MLDKVFGRLILRRTQWVLSSTQRLLLPLLLCNPAESCRLLRSSRQRRARDALPLSINSASLFTIPRDAVA